MIPEETEAEALEYIEHVQEIYWREQGSAPGHRIEIPAGKPLAEVLHSMVGDPTYLPSMAALTLFLAGGQATGGRIVIENFHVERAEGGDQSR